jgi:hypothetical protein
MFIAALAILVLGFGIPVLADDVTGILVDEA